MMKGIGIVLFASALLGAPASGDELLIPVIRGPWTRIANNPDLGELTSPRQEPVDFAVWQAADGNWQAWSCIRHTKCDGHTRLLYRWESEDLMQADWKPMGIAMVAEEQYGEHPGGLQAPHVIKSEGTFHMFYGDWNHICHAISKDGKSFERVIQADGKTGMFEESPQLRLSGDRVNTRDIMMLDVNGVWYGFYTARPNRQGAVYCRTTRDFLSWSPSTVVAFGGRAGTGPGSAECPHVVSRHGRYYLFRTQQYGKDGVTSIYTSGDPLMFGINQDERYFVSQLPVAAPEIVRHEGQDFIIALTPELDGLRIAPLDWTPRP